VEERGSNVTVARAMWRSRAMVILVPLAGCVSIHSDNVLHGPGRASYPGYSVDYVDASPSPGTPVTKGSLVKFQVKVRYSLMRAERGRLQLQFSDEGNQPLLVGSEVTRGIVKTGADTAILSQEVTIPDVRLDLVVCVYVVPEGDRGASGELRIRYPVADRRR